MSGPPGVVILAAGRGRRLAPHTDERPKCLLELAPGRTLLGRQLEQLAARRVTRVVVVAGYRAGDVARALDAAPPGLAVELVENPRFDASGSAASLLAASARVQGAALLISHGDLVYADALLDGVLAAPGLATAVDLGFATGLGDEVLCRLAGARVVGIAPLQRVPPPRGRFVGLTRLDGASAAALFTRCAEQVAADPGVDYELGPLHALVSEAQRVCAAVGFRGLRWVNVNRAADLDVARAGFGGAHV